MPIKSLAEELIEYAVIKDRMLTADKESGVGALWVELDTADNIIRNAINEARCMVIKMRSVSKAAYEAGKEAAKEDQAND